MSGRPHLALIAIYLTVVLDAAGIGLVLPVLPDLFMASGHAASGFTYGLFLSLYAFMQFIFAPLLGSLSDRFGRRPVLMVSMAGAVVNYGLMALLPPLWLLFVGRAVAGISNANMSVASACLTDITAPEDRARRFGQLSASFGVGFILGPALGGVLSRFSLHWPFAIAAVLTACNLAFTVFVLPETRRRGAGNEHAAVNPLAPLSAIASFRGIAPLLICAALFAVIGEIGGSVWVLYGEGRFHWHGVTVGLSLALFGLFHALCQAFLVGPLTRRFGERGTLIIAMAADAASYVAIALISNGIYALLLTPLFCVGGAGASVLSAAISHKAGDDRQGALQGVLSSLGSLAAVIAPVLFLSLYFATRAVFPGLVWIIGAGLYLLCLPVLLNRKTYAS